MKTSEKEIQNQITFLLNENMNFRNENILLNNRIKELEEQLNWLKKQIFGKKSERLIEDRKSEQMYIPGLEPYEKEIEKETDVASHKRITTKKESEQFKISEDIPIESTILDISAEKKVCPISGKALVKIGEAITDKLAHKPGSFFLKRIIRPKYALPKGEGIITTDLPDSILNRCKADESFLAEVITRKFADHLPLYRLSEIFSRSGISISRQLLSKWVVKIGLTLKPLQDLMLQKILESKNIFVDETHVYLQNPNKNIKAYMWCIAGGKQRDPSYKVYLFFKDRKHENILSLLQEYKGVFHSDKYGAYDTLAKSKNIIWSPCWAHVRRKFFEAKAGDKKFKASVLDKIKKLFMLERDAWEGSPEERLQIRQDQEVPLIDELIKEVEKKSEDNSILPKSKLFRAIGYFCRLSPNLKNYTKYPWARMDNNVAERAIRPLVIGRKNWLFVGSPEAGVAAGVLLSLVQTCRALKINPREYLEDILRRFMGHSVKRLHELLPEAWIEGKKIKKPP